MKQEHPEVTHEELSGKIVRQIYDQNTNIFNYNNLTEDHVEVIKSLITGNVFIYSDLNNMY